MWLFTPIGFFSIVQKAASNHLTVRARAREDLDALRQSYLPSLSETMTKGGTDYPYRATASHAAFSDALAKIGKNIGYDNFKDEVASRQGVKRAQIYGHVWTTLLDLQSAPAKTSKEKSGKVLSYGGVVINGSGNVLLVERRDHFDGYVWTFPKGRPNEGESPEATAAREVMERTGQITGVVTEIPGRYAGGTTVNQYFLMKSRGPFNTIPSNNKVVSLKWASYGEARALIRKSLSPHGMERDLTVLDAGYLAWHRSLIEDRHRFEHREPTLRTNWKVEPMTGEISSFRIDRSFSNGEMDQIRRGSLPAAMEEKWFIFFEDNCLHVCRSWTGMTIFLAAFSKIGAGVWKIDSVQMPGEVLKNQGAPYAAGLFQYLIDTLLLGTTGEMPELAGASPEEQALNAWHQVGSASIGK